MPRSRRHRIDDLADGMRRCQRTGSAFAAPRAGGDGKAVLLIEIDERKAGIHREVRYEITPAELIAAIRAHGAELPGEQHNR